MNMDGDFDDNSMKRIPSTTGTIAVTYLSNTITLSAAITTGYSSLIVGDGIIINGFNYIIASIVTANTVFTISDVYQGTSDGTAVGYKHLETQSKASRGDFEAWPGGFPTAVDEGHHPMECSNRGSCDRKTGLCKCFPGYDGTACQRTTCPNDCSGHGTCQKVSELRTQDPKRIAGTVSGDRGNNYLLPSEDMTASLSVGSSILLGDHATPYTITAITALSIRTSVADNGYPKTFPANTPVYLIPRYNLWDGDKNRACKCDARFSGYDCSERKCPRGDDPLTVGQFFETQTIDIGLTANYNYVQSNTLVHNAIGSFKLIFTDYFGEQWTTVAIPVDGATDKSAEVKAALEGLPNDVVKGVTVTFLGRKQGIRYFVKFDGGTITSQQR
jgi:hypothetical protein